MAENTELSIFEFSSYKDFLKAFSGPNKRSGVKSRMAEAAECNTTYVSAVLNGQAHFSPEQTLKIAGAFGLSKRERDFLLLLLSRERAGTLELKKFYDEKISAALAEQLDLKNRLKSFKELSESDRVRYYSAWYYSAVEIALSIPGLRTKKSLSERFGLPPQKITEILDFLLQIGLIQQKGEEYFLSEEHIHLPKNSESIARHHSNWRQQAMRAFDHADENLANTHYSAVTAVSREDALKIKDALLETIKNTLNTLSHSTEQEIFVFNLDWFRLP